MVCKRSLVLVLAVITALALSSAGIGAERKFSVAVLDFESIGTEEYLGKAVSEIIRTALVGNQSYRVVERAQINKALTEQKFQKSGVIDDRSAVEIGKILGADLIMVGSVVKIGNAYTINSRLIDVKTAEAKLGRNITGTDLNLLTSMSNELVENFFGMEPKKPKPASDQNKISEQPQAGKRSYLDLDRWEVLNGNWYATDGAIIGSGGHLILREDFQDYIFEVTAEHLSGPKLGVGIGTRCSVVPGGQKTFRNNTSINQGYTFNFAFTKTYNIYSGISGNWYPMHPTWRKYEWLSSDVFDEQINRIRIEAVGRHIKIYVNSRFLVEYADTAHVVGAPLLWVQDPAEKIRFYNIRIQKN